MVWGFRYIHICKIRAIKVILLLWTNRWWIIYGQKMELKHWTYMLQMFIAIFSIPSLRNIALSSPYMHDGRFKTLKQVINHYSIGIQANSSLSHTLKDWNSQQPVRFNFSDQDKKALIAFLNTLKDWDFISKEMFSDPFPKNWFITHFYKLKIVGHLFLPES